MNTIVIQQFNIVNIYSHSRLSTMDISLQVEPH